jgi:hypothetical protein
MTQKEGLDMVEAFRLSGLTQKDWCAKHQRGIHVLKYWIKRSKTLPAQQPGGQATHPGFASVQIDRPRPDTATPETAPVLSITFPNGVKLECPATMPLSDIQSLIQTF